MKAHGWKWTAMVMVVVCGISLVGCAGHFGSKDEQWYSAHPLSKAQVVAQWGTPDRVISHEDGIQELIYLREMPLSGGARSTEVYQIKNDMVVKHFWKAL